MAKKNSQLWFKRKTYGWGWTPCSWQGWLVIFLWLFFFYVCLYWINQSTSLKIASMFFLTVGLLTITYLTGETPRWQWGKTTERKRSSRQIRKTAKRHR